MALITLCVGCPLTVVDKGPCRRCEHGVCDLGPDACEQCRAEWCPDADPDADPESEAAAR